MSFTRAPGLPQEPSSVQRKGSQPAYGTEAGELIALPQVSGGRKGKAKLQPVSFAIVWKNPYTQR